jgi:hemerythrin
MFDWDEKYSVGIQYIDNQHKEIFVLLNQIYFAYRKGNENEVIDQIIPDLEKYTVLHFRKEEFFFRKFNYEFTEEHILEHENFRRNIQTIKSDISAGKTKLGIELMELLTDWIEHHIFEVDKKYADCFRQNGLK